MTSENRESPEEHRAAFFADTQPGGEVLRQRLPELRRERKLTQKALAKAMQAVDVPVDVSKIERGKRDVKVEELLALAYVLDVPLSRLLSAPLGDRPLRAGGVGLEHHEVGNWMVWGDPAGIASFRGRTRMRLAREAATMAQVLVDDEADPAKRREQRETTARLLTDLARAFGIRPGVMKRQALRDQMAQVDD